MDDRVLCRVMLYSYNALESKCEDIDKALYNTAVRSAFKETWKAYTEMERLIREKTAYINTKVIIDQALAGCNKKYEIEQHHIKGVSKEQIATTLNVSVNTIEKRLARQSERIYETILHHHSGAELLEIICDSDWLLNRYKRAINQAQNKK